MAAPGDHPFPPRSGYTGALAMTWIPKDRTWFRLYRHRYAPLHFGTTRRARFDAARGEFGVLYAARQIAGAFVETLARGGVRAVSHERLQRYRVAEIAASRAVSLVDLTGRGLVRMGVDRRLTTGAYQIAQRWSSAFFAHRDRPDGILYASRHDPGQQRLRHRVAVRATRPHTSCDRGRADGRGRSLAVSGGILAGMAAVQGRFKGRVGVPDPHAAGSTRSSSTAGSF